MSDNWIVVVARNNLDLLKQAIKSFEAQDVEGGCKVLVVNNASSDGTASWLHSNVVRSIHHYPQRGVAHAWNSALKYLFSLCGKHAVDRVLVCNSDVVLRPDTWRLLAAEKAPFVTAVGSDDKKAIAELTAPRPDAKRPHPDFSCFMISRGCFERVGAFDERYEGAFCEDSDYHCRMHQAGIKAYSIDLAFWHVGGGSQTIKRANETERKRIAKQAMKNREYFRDKWGFEVPNRENEGKAYYRFFHVPPPEDIEKAQIEAEKEAARGAGRPRTSPAR